jgi:hypothetical protein
MRSRLLVAVLFLFATSLVAKGAIVFDMTTDLMATTANDTIGIPDGMAIFVVALTSGSSFAAPIPGNITTGSDWGGSSNDIVIWSFAANGTETGGSPGEMENLSPQLTYAEFPGWGFGDKLAVFWLPAVAYSGSGTTISVGNTYGEFSYFSSGDDAADWTTPSDPSFNYGLNYLTPNGDVFGPGNDVGTFGTVTSVPEPAVFGLTAGVMALGAGMVYRRKRT